MNLSYLRYLLDSLFFICSVLFSLHSNTSLCFIQSYHYCSAVYRPSERIDQYTMDSLSWLYWCFIREYKFILSLFILLQLCIVQYSISVSRIAGSRTTHPNFSWQMAKNQTSTFSLSLLSHHRHLNLLSYLLFTDYLWSILQQSFRFLSRRWLYRPVCLWQRYTRRMGIARTSINWNVDHYHIQYCDHRTNHSTETTNTSTDYLAKTS